MLENYDTHIQNIDLQVKSIVSRAVAYMKDAEPSFVEASIIEAYEFSKEAHKNDSRLSGEPYISHPVAATEILLSLSPDIATIQACFMHDVIEDTQYTYDDIFEVFGHDVAELCA